MIQKTIHIQNRDGTTAKFHITILLAENITIYDTSQYQYVAYNIIKNAKKPLKLVFS